VGCCFLAASWCEIPQFDIVKSLELSECVFGGPRLSDCGHDCAIVELWEVLFLSDGGEISWGRNSGGIVWGRSHWEPFVCNVSGLAQRVHWLLLRWVLSWIGWRELLPPRVGEIGDRFLLSHPECRSEVDTEVCKFCGTVVRGVHSGA
jgi:hypothetical protein